MGSPAAWLMVLMVYIPKGSCREPTNIFENRPLSLRSILGKLYPRILYLRLKTMLMDTWPFFQLGYKEGLGSDQAMWAISALIHEQPTNDKEVWVLLCDWSKAYDRVWRAKVMLLLHANGVNGAL